MSAKEGIMARPEKRDVEYFPFYVKDGRTLHILEDKYGCKGTGFFTNVLRFLSERPDHHFSISAVSDRLWFFSRTKCDEESGLDMLNIMAITGKIESDLWSKWVIASQAFLDSVEDAYRKRANNIITIEEIKDFYGVSGNGNTHGSVFPATETTEDTRCESITTASNPQSIVKKSIVKKSKTPILDNFIVSDSVKEWAKEKGFNKLDEHLEAFKLTCTANGYKYINWDAAFKKAIINDWARLRKEGRHQGGNGNARTTTNFRDKHGSGLSPEQEREADAINAEYYRRKALEAADKTAGDT